MSRTGPTSPFVRLPTWSREARRWTLANGDVMVVEVQDFDGNKQVAMRRWYKDREGNLKPTRSGMSFTFADFPEVVRTFEALAPKVSAAVAALAAHQGSDDVDLAPSPDLERTAAPAGPRASPFRPFPGRWPMAAALAVKPAPPLPPQPVEAVAVPAPPAAGPGVTLAAIIEAGFVAAPLPVRIDTRSGRQSGIVYANGQLVFGNRQFATPREAVRVLSGSQHVIDGWQAIKYLNPVTKRYAKLSRLRNLFVGMAETAGEDD